MVPFLVLPQTIPVCRSHQPFCFHILARSLSSPKKSTPLESSKSRLFSQNTRGGGYRENRVFGINNIQTLFSDSVCKSVTPPGLSGLSLRPDASLAIQSTPFFFSLCVNSAFSAPGRYPRACRFCRACPLRRAFVFTTIRTAFPPARRTLGGQPLCIHNHPHCPGGVSPAAIPLATRLSPLLPWNP